MKIGILGHGLVVWGGGIGFAALITNALAAAGPDADIHVFLPLRQPVKRVFPSLIAKWIAARGTAAPHDDPGKEIVLDAFAGLMHRVTLQLIEDGRPALHAALQ